MFEAQIEYETAQASSAALGGLLTKAFDVAKNVFTSEGSGGGATYMGGYVDGGAEVDAGLSDPYQFYDPGLGDEDV